MANFGIGLSGLRVAQQALEMVGTNLANAATQGYHRQEPRIAPQVLGSADGAVGGAAVVGFTRTGDVLVEDSILRQQPLSGQIAQELAALQTVEGSLGTIGSQALGDSLRAFFDSLRQLASQPNSQPLLVQAAIAGDTLAGEFRRLDQALGALCDDVSHKTGNLVVQVNEYSKEIAQLNVEIEAALNRRQNANLLMDKRDQAISELSLLADVQVTRLSDSTGQADVSVWGTSIVVRGHAIALEAGMAPGGQLGISVAGSNRYQTALSGGSLGGLVTLKNQTLQDIRDSLDALAGQVAEQVNRLHVQGIGTDGPFTELTGSPVGDGPLSSWDADISAGQFYVRITNQDTGQVTRLSVAVDPDDALSDVVARINALRVGIDQPLTASVADSRLHIQAGAGYKFDFLPSPTAGPSSSTLTGTSQPSISGSYAGESNQTYTLTVLGDGQVGVTDGLRVEVRNGAGELVRALNVGLGYAAGDSLEIDQGLRVAMGSGTLKVGESFQVQALADSDPTGFLASAGMNTFFRGNTAGQIAVDPRILEDPGRIAASLSPAGDNNANVLRMADLQAKTLPALGDATFTEYLDQLVTGVGQRVQVLQTRKSAIDDMIQQLRNQRDAVSGVDVNLEVANLLVYQRMFQSVAKYLSATDQMLQYLNQMLQ